MAVAIAINLVLGSLTVALRLPLYLDSPMAKSASDIYRAHPDAYDEETAALERAARTAAKSMAGRGADWEVTQG